MTSLETIELILKFVTLIGLIGIAVGVVRKHVDAEDFPLYPALGFTAVAGALWIVMSLLLQPGATTLTHPKLTVTLAGGSVRRWAC
jgi:hypothetical protein